MGVKLLNDEERAQLPLVLLRRNKFKKLIGTSIVNYNTMFSNCLLIKGKPGTGKTTLVMEYLELLKQKGSIADYTRVAGHVTPQALYRMLKANSQPDNNGSPKVFIMDDVDCLSHPGCLELMKAAFDTKAQTASNRKVCYLSEDSNGFKFNGFGIIITNEELNPETSSPHTQALLDRVQQVNADLKKEDAMIYSTYLIEDYLNSNPDNLTEDQIDSTAALFSDEIRKWYEADAFRKTGINFSIRLVKKFIDIQSAFGSDWKEFNTTYQQLNTATELYNTKKELGENVEDICTTAVRLSVDDKGNILNPKTGQPYSPARQSYYRKLAAASKTA